MPSFREQWVAETTSGWGDWVDIDPALSGTLSSGTLIRGASSAFAGGGVHRYIATIVEADCFFPGESDAVAPTYADPPFPPVYPYLFATNDIYGRDHLSLNLKMVRGDTYSFTAAIILNGDPVDLTGGVVRMTAKWSVSDTDGSAVFQLSSAATGITITDAINGEISVVIGASLTTSLPAKKVELPYDIQFVDAAGLIYTVLYGTLTVVPDITITT